MVPSQSEYVRVQRTVLQASHTLAKKSRGALQLGQASTTAVTNDSFKRESSIETAAIAGKKTILIWKCSECNCIMLHLHPRCRNHHCSATPCVKTVARGFSDVAHLEEAQDAQGCAISESTHGGLMGEHISSRFSLHSIRRIRN